MKAAAALELEELAEHIPQRDKLLCGRSLAGPFPTASSRAPQERQEYSRSTFISLPHTTLLTSPHVEGPLLLIFFLLFRKGIMIRSNYWKGILSLQ